MKQLSQAKQFAVLRMFRQQCPFCVLSGPYGYTCGGLTGGVSKYSSGCGKHGSQKERRCTLGCKRLLITAFKNGYNITISKQKLLGI